MTEEGSSSPGEFHTGEWLQAEGPQVDIAICTRVRMARNIQGYHFTTSMGTDEARDLATYVGEQLAAQDLGEQFNIVDVATLDELERSVLVERHLISREHAIAKWPRTVAINPGESISVMVNEEDHIRAQVFASGLRLQDAHDRAQHLDEALMARLPFAFSEEFGFLTVCPTNTGTGMRVSVMMHLPGLVWADEIDKATNTAQKIHLAVRGLYGEGSRALGDFYQVSNQVTLGRSESQILSDVEVAVQKFVTWEREVRQALMRGDSRSRTLDRIFRSLGVLERAHILTSEEALNCLSAVRFGVQQELIDGLEIAAINRALLLSQPAHLQRYCREKLDPADRDQKRATLVRSLLAEGRT